MRDRKMTIIVGILALAAGLVLPTAWQNLASPSGGSNAPNRKTSRAYAMNVAISSMPFWDEPRQTWQAIGRETPDLKTIFGGPPNADATRQIAEVESLLAQNLDGLIVFSTDPDSLVSTVDKAVARGIPVVTVFADLPKSKRIAYVGANQIESARAVAHLAMQDYPDRVKPSSKVLIVAGKVGAEDQDDRRAGFAEEIGSKMTVLTPAVDDYTADKAAQVIRAAFAVHPDIKFILGCDSQSAVGAVAALKELGKKPGDVVVTAWDSDPAVLLQIKSDGEHQGWVLATSVLYSSYMVETAFGLLEAAHFGYLYPTMSTGSTAPKVPAAPQTIYIPMRIITASNVDELMTTQRGENK